MKRPESDLLSSVVDANDIYVVHVPYCYYPGPVGGTETYVAGLAAALEAIGIRSAVAAPSRANAAYEHAGIPTFGFSFSTEPSIESAYGAPDEVAAKSFEALLLKLKPRLVHIHAKTAAVSARLVDVAHAAGAKVVFTYHTPTVSCGRGTMMRMGLEPCDGRLDVRRCTTCVLQSRGVPALLRAPLAALPPALGDALGSAGLGGGAFTALRLSALVGGSHRQFQAMMDKADHVVAVCDWVGEALRLNGVPPAKITLCRQGVAARTDVNCAAAPRSAAAAGPLRIGYFGRVDPTKGIDLLIEAIRRSPGLAVRLDVYGVLQPGSESYMQALERAAELDARIAIHPGLPPDLVGKAMPACDLVAVPSRWLETGPMVVLEAFQAGAPVLGARLGGIAELVSDGVDGRLVAPDDPRAWADAIAALVADPAAVARLKSGVRPPRTMDDVAREMAALYETVLARP